MHYSLLIIDENGYVIDELMKPFDENLFAYRTNPEGEWDWWQKGGRWSGQWLLKSEFIEDAPAQPDQFLVGYAPVPKGRCDEAAKYQIDFSGHIEQIRQQLTEEWLTLDKATRGLPKPLTLDALSALHPNITDRSEMYQRYCQQPYCQAVFRAVNSGFFDVFCFVDVSMEDYVQKRLYATAYPFYALMIDGEWIGCSDMESDELWGIRIREAIENASDGAIFTVVDCHC